MNERELIAQRTTVLYLSGVENSTAEMKWFSCFFQYSLKFRAVSSFEPDLEIYRIFLLFPHCPSYYIWEIGDDGAFYSAFLSLLAYTHLLRIFLLFLTWVLLVPPARLCLSPSLDHSVLIRASFIFISPGFVSEQAGRWIP